MDIERLITMYPDKHFFLAFFTKIKFPLDKANILKFHF